MIASAGVRTKSRTLKMRNETTSHGELQMPSIVFIRRCEHCHRSFKARQGNARICKREECRREDVKQYSRKRALGEGYAKASQM